MEELRTRKRRSLREIAAELAAAERAGPAAGKPRGAEAIRLARARQGGRMTHQDEAAATDRLRRALLAFRTAQNHLLGAHRRLKGLPPAEVDAFWDAKGRRLETDVRATAAELVAAFQRFSAAGLVADAADRHLVTQAQRHLAEDA